MSNNYKLNLAVAYHLDLDYITTSNEAGDLFVVVNGEVFDPCNNINQAAYHDGKRYQYSS